MEADLLRAGFTLDDFPKRLNLRAVRQFTLYAERGSAVYRLARGEKADWGHQEELLTRVIEVLNDANWQRQGNKFAPKPKRLPRPGDAPPAGVQHFGSPGGYSISEFERIWAERTAA